MVKFLLIAYGSNRANCLIFDSILATAQLLLQSFLISLRQAVAAQKNGQLRTRLTCLEVAALLYSIEDESIDALALDLIHQQQFADAIILADLIDQLGPGNVLSSFRLGYALQMANQHREAVTPYRQALAIDPDFPKLRNNLAAALIAIGADTDEPRGLLDSAIKADPEDIDAWINLMHVCRTQMDLDGALNAGVSALELAPDSILALNGYASTLKEAQRWDEAEKHLSTARILAPTDASVRSSLAKLHLLRGNYAKGWPENEARWDGSAELRGKRPMFLSSLAWRGESLAKKTLLVWGEQGMGDLLQFCRFIPLVAERVHREGGRIIWNSFPQMGALLVRSFGGHVDEYTAGEGVEALPQFDYEISLLSLPFILRISESAIPASVPYLQPDAVARAAWRARLSSQKRLRVGLAWTGSLDHQRNRFRSVGWRYYARWFSGIPGVTFYSLQPDATKEVAAAKAAGLAMTDYTAEFTSFDDTAAFVGELDLVVTTCTSVAHLSGALGQHTWVLLDVNPHWPWLLGRRDSPWYPTATLYRQRQFGKWDTVLKEVVRDLTALVERSAVVVKLFQTGR
jgi:tetratricopeptide (TPR) repeat protein